MKWKYENKNKQMNSTLLLLSICGSEECTCKIIKDKYFIKTFNKTPSNEMLEEVLELVIVNEVIKIHEDERYKEIVKKFLN